MSKRVPQVPLLGPLLFNIFMNDFFYATKHSRVCNVTDDKTIFACGETLDEVTKCVENDMRIAMNWLKLNEMVANPAKLQLIFFGPKEDHEVSIIINGYVIKCLI